MNNKINNTEYWLLQTQLKHKLLRTITQYLKNDSNNHLVDLSFIKKQFNINIEEKNVNKKNIISRFELEKILSKPFMHPALLAFEYLGNIQILNQPIVAIIGSRRPTYYGRQQTHHFAKTLAEHGMTIVSGGALGIDAIANAVGHEYGSSCAVIGSGIEKPYPASNIKLFHSLAASNRGLVLSEFNSEDIAQKWNFPRRNISIAALADFILVIEAKITSGSLITAHAALDLGIDVGALPGDINRANSCGTIELIKNGAFCIKTPYDVIERVQYITKTYRKNDLFSNKGLYGERIF
ncbi:MAG: DNA-processing protein DprA [Spirobacillus cienkowskii]|jgi:DNA processing protein|uniref:DNA-processing protein DprA n=1 Tax=Spirobacillus cienkowskii TaxID=495820 RepID=A0A369KUV1_9BACT|nr:MAG: DNA-processing protein DprA [Spirobacillus cienkowskii]